MSPLRSLVSLAVLGLVSATANGFPADFGRRAPSTSKTVIAQMFEWTWDSIAAECTAFLGPAGYGFVQSSFCLLYLRSIC